MKILQLKAIQCEKSLIDCVMYKIATPLFLVCETPLHAGSGDSLGVVDLPIQRERHTSFPKIEGSSLKGALRQAFEDISVPVQSGPENKYKLLDKGSGKKLWEACSRLDDVWMDEKGQPRTNKDKTVQLTKYQEAIALTFGPEEAGGDGHAGALGFSDARLLLFPVKSMKGVFAWVTCPKVLQQFKKDMVLTSSPYTNEMPGKNCVPQSCTLFVKDKTDKRIVLEEYTFIVNEDENVTDLCTILAKWLSQNVTSDNFWQNKMEKDIIVLRNEDFTDFVNLSTEVITRTKINNATGTVAQGQLFTEEYLPAESVMYSLVLASPVFKENDDDKGAFRMSLDNPCFTDCENEESKVMKFFETALPDVIQIGGNATLGKGLVRTKVLTVNSVPERGRGAEDAAK